MKPFLICALLSIYGSIAAAQNKIIPIWQPGNSNAERYEQLDPKNSSNISEVHQPTLTVFLPSRRDAHHSAVLIFPGGRYRQIVIGKEGYNIAQWLNDHGIAAFVLTYRLDRDSALQDAQQAVRLIRKKAREYAIDPDRIGVMGFSAGANLSLNLATHTQPSFRAAEHLDTVSCRPDFMVLVYGGFRGLTGLVNKNSPPAFIAHAGDDDRAPVSQSIVLYSALRQAGVPVEMHIYERGGHGFALLEDRGPVVSWAQRCMDWMKIRNIISQR